MGSIIIINMGSKYAESSPRKKLLTGLETARSTKLAMCDGGAGEGWRGEVTTGSHLHTIHTIHSPLQGFSLSSVCGLTGFQSRKLTRATIMADWRTYSLASEDSFPHKKTHFIIRRESKLRECHRVVGDGFREVPH